MDRPNLFVIARFLHRLEDGPVPRGRLQLMVRLNYDIFRRYLDLLEQRGHIESKDVDGSSCLAVTDAGRQAHARLRKALHDWLDESHL